MYQVRKEITVDRSERIKRNRQSQQQNERQYQRESGVRRIVVLHPTKGFRDRNINRILQVSPWLRLRQSGQ